MFLIGIITFVIALFMIWTANPVYMVMSLVLVSLGLGTLSIGVGAQFVGFVVVLVYVGAVNVLFLFVIMMINLRVQLVAFTLEHTSYTALLLALTLFEPLSFTLCTEPLLYTWRTTFSLGELGGFLFSTDRVFGNLMVSGVLFVAMVSAICLTMVFSENYRTQSFFAQTDRSSALFAFVNRV